MKRLKYLLSAIMLLFLLISLNAKASSFTNEQITADTVISPAKDQIAKELVQLRDSIDLSILSVQKKREGEKANYKQRLDKVYNDLTLQRTEIEKVIEEVVITNEKTWDANIRTRALEQIGTRRRDYHQILKDIKEITGSKSYH